MVRWLRRAFGRVVHHPIARHRWTPYSIGERRLVGMYGVTKDPVNVRTCLVCGMSQQENVDPPPDECDASAYLQRPVTGSPTTRVN